MHPKIVTDKAEFIHRILSFKENNQKIVVTNGCFDLLHEGHLHLLREARKLGDLLVVLINSDSSIKLLKGNSRPIESLEARMENLAAVPVVDAIVVFEEETPTQIISMIKPHILVKGADYQGKYVAGVQYCQQLVFIPLLEGYSTSNIISTRSNL